MSPPSPPRPLLPAHTHPSPSHSRTASAPLPSHPIALLRSSPRSPHAHPHGHHHHHHQTNAFEPGIVTRRRLLLLLALVGGALVSLVLAGETLYRPPRIPDLPIPKEMGYSPPYSSSPHPYPGSGSSEGSERRPINNNNLPSLPSPDQALPGLPGHGVNKPPKPQSPKLSLVVVWEDKDGPQSARSRPSFPYFLESVRANAPLVELVLVWVRQEDEDSCEGLLGEAGEGGEGDNVKLVCLSRVEHWELHRDYFCASERWDCSPEEREEVLRVMLERHDLDWYKSFFRIYRGWVFSRYMSPGVDWWGWADFDTVMGNYGTQFPWSATTYDVLIPSTPSDTLLYLRGHLAFFSSSRETEFKMLQYPNLRGVREYVERHVPGEYLAIEESEFSAYIIRNPEISFLSLPDALIHIPVHLFSPQTLKYATPRGVFRTSLLDPPVTPSITDMPVLNLTELVDTSPTPKVFSPKGITRPVRILAGSYEYGLWFPLQYATHYNHFHPIPEGWRRIVGRGGGYRGGEEGVWERLEPPREGRWARAVDGGLRDDEGVQGGGGGLEVELVEGLYIHWFEEKWNGEWYNNLPPFPLRSNQALVTAERHGARIWDIETGEVTWRGEKLEEPVVGGVDLRVGEAPEAEVTELPQVGGMRRRRRRRSLGER